MEDLILEVGCGDTPLKKALHTDINKKALDLDVMCDAHYLPFMDSVFSVVYSSHVLEHLENPLLALKEMRRVSLKYVYLRVPNGSYAKFDQMKSHLFTWNANTFSNLLSHVFDKVEVTKGLRVQRKQFKRYLPYLFTRIKLEVLSVLRDFPELEAVCKIRRENLEVSKMRTKSES